MKQSDFDRLKAVCEKEGFDLLNESVTDNDKFFVVKKAKDIWENVEFVQNVHSDNIHPCNRIINYKNLLNWKPSTESAYTEQLKSECFKRFGEIKEGDRFDRSKMDFNIPQDTDVIFSTKNGFKYYKDCDQFFFGNIAIYHAGKWATRVKERVKVDFSMSETCDNSYKVYFGINNAAKVIRDQNGLDIGKYLASKLEEYLNK